MKKEPKCPSLDDGLEKMGSIEIVGYCSAIRKDEILPFATTWMDPENIMLREIRQSEKAMNHMISLMCGI